MPGTGHVSLEIDLDPRQSLTSAASTAARLGSRSGSPPRTQGWFPHARQKRRTGRPGQPPSRREAEEAHRLPMPIMRGSGRFRKSTMRLSTKANLHRLVAWLKVAV